MVPSSALSSGAIAESAPSTTRSASAGRLSLADVREHAALWLLRHLQPRMVSGSVASFAMILVVALSAMVYHALPKRRPGRSAPAVQVSRPPVSRPAQPVPTQTAPPLVVPARAAAQDVRDGVKATATNIPASTKAPARESAKRDLGLPAPRSASNEDDEETKQKAHHGGIGYTQAELRNLVFKADHLAGNGEYDEAISLYEIVLRNDPKDAEAHRGLARARENKSERR